VVNEKLNKQVEGLEKLERRVSKSVIPLFQSLPYYSMVFMALLLVGVFQFAGVGFDPAKVREWQFWVPVFIISVSIFIIFTSTAKEYQQKYMAQDTYISTVKASMNERVKGKSFLRLPEFLANKNLTLRIEKWKELLSIEERRLDKKASEDDLYIYTKGTQQERLDNEYCRKKADINARGSDEYIAKHIVYIKMKVLQYTMAMVLADISMDGQSAFLKNENVEITKSAIYKVIARMAFSASLGTLILTTNTINIDTMIKLIGNLFILVATFFDAVLLGKVIVETIVKARYTERLQLLDEYFEWHKKEDKI
jgi:hypothetical protein